MSQKTLPNSRGSALDMEQFPPKFSKVLVTADPHYIPGYAGYCPQLKYSLGKSYGKLTAKLLTSPNISHSRRLVLQTGSFHPVDTPTDTPMLPRTEIWRSRNTHGRQLLRMIPGYTGFIPESQNYFSKTYAETCREALSEFGSDQRRRVQLASEEFQPTISYTLPDSKPHKLNTPLKAISKEPLSYEAVGAWKPQGSPYFIEDSSPHKYFISGFTGYVPKARFLIGTSYPITTNKALIQFGKEMKAGHCAPSMPKEEAENLPQIPTIYPAHQGLMPSYTGHVPGYKFRYGQTFGQLTSNVLSGVTHRRKQARSPGRLAGTCQRILASNSY
ncbi:ciliary microtubule inner protein 2B [Brachyhypopomus gauderio]|uniref:ciliary microtubule inner protein 2B n=1 Tax=Brachyhypopomus gauderio TaxID=698409 RepID=UPI004041376D